MLNKVKDNFFVKKQFESMLKNNNNFVISGKYKMHFSSRFVYKNDKKTINYVNNVLLKDNMHWYANNKFKNIIKALLNIKPIKISDNNEGFKGSIIILKNNRCQKKDCIILDLFSQQLLTKYNKENDMKKKMKNYSYFKEYFNIPNVLKNDCFKKIVVEKLIESIPKKEWNQNDYVKIINDIFNSYEKYYEKIAIKKKRDFVNAEFYYNELSKDRVFLPLLKILKNKISNELFYENFPRVYQHGDLHLQNIILSKKDQIYYIDWDYSQNAMFYYDIFIGLFLESEYCNQKYFDLLINGDYDYFLEKIFNIWNCCFYKTKRVEYFYIALMEDVYFRTSSWDEISKSNLVNKYKKILKT